MELSSFAITKDGPIQYQEHTITKAESLAMTEPDAPDPYPFPPDESIEWAHGWWSTLVTSNDWDHSPVKVKEVIVGEICHHMIKTEEEMELRETSRKAKTLQNWRDYFRGSVDRKMKRMQLLMPNHIFPHSDLSLDSGSKLAKLIQHFLDNYGGSDALIDWDWQLREFGKLVERRYNERVNGTSSVSTAMPVRHEPHSRALNTPPLSGGPLGMTEASVSPSPSSSGTEVSLPTPEQITGGRQHTPRITIGEGPGRVLLDLVQEDVETLDIGKGT